SSTINSYNSTGCPAHDTTYSASLNNTIFWADSTQAAGDWVQVASTQTSATFTFNGSLYVPAPGGSAPSGNPTNCSNSYFGGTVCTENQAVLIINGVAIVNYWDVQSGNHPNPFVNFTATNAPDLREDLR